MVRRHIAGRGISDARVLEAMAAVPRERFVERSLSHRAYADGPLPIGHGQTISQPYVVAWMAEAAQLGTDDRVLEVGTGSGYAAAVLSLLCDAVYSEDMSDQQDYDGVRVINPFVERTERASDPPAV